MFCKSCGMSCNCRLFAHAWSGIFGFFGLNLFLQHMQINSFMIYMLSCSTSSGTNCGHLCVVLLSFSWDVCLCNFITYQCDNILLLSHYSYCSLWCETAAQFSKITYDGSMCTHIQVFGLVLSESLLLWLHLHTLHDMVKVDFSLVCFSALLKMYIYIALQV